MKLLGHQLNTHLRDFIELYLATNSLSKKISGTNTSILYSKAVARKIIQLYEGQEAHNIDCATGNLGFGLIHYSFLLNIKPTRILCIGSKKGFIPAICALACQENNKGVVDFVDAGYDQKDKNNWGGIGLWKKIDPKKYFSFLGIHSRINIQVTTTKEFAAKSKYKYEYIYVDGDHSYKGVKTDFNLFWPRVKKNGFMAFHDVYVKHLPGSAQFGVWKFWQEMKIGTKILLPYQTGLGILQKI